MSQLLLTSRCISCLFRFADDGVGIENIKRSEIFQRSESSSVAMTQPAGCGGDNDFIKTFTNSKTTTTISGF